MRGTRAKDLREQAGGRHGTYRTLKRRWQDRHDQPVAWPKRSTHGRPATPNLNLWQRVRAGKLEPAAAVAELAKAVGFEGASQTRTLHRLVRLMALAELKAHPELKGD